MLTLVEQVGIIAAALDAPGPLIATSTKPEVIDVIVEHRIAPAGAGSGSTR